MKRIILLIVVGLLLALMGYRFVQHRSPRQVQTIAQIHQNQGYPVQVDTVRVGPYRERRSYTGTVVGGEEADVVSPLGEYIASVPVREGQWVERDQIICVLSHDNPSARYRSAELALQNAVREAERVKRLYEQGAVSRQVLDAAELQRDLAQEALTAAAKLLEVRSPIAGRITELHAEAGAFAPPGMKLARVVSNGRLRVRVEVPADDRPMVKMGCGASVIAGGKAVSGRVSRVALSADARGRTFPAWIELLEKPADFNFSPGLMVGVDVDVVSLDSAVTVSSDALQRKGDTWQVFVVSAGRAHVIPVQVGGRNAQQAWLTGGVGAGEVVVVAGANLLEDGAPVRIINAAQ